MPRTEHQIEKHEVVDENKRILICPFCGYAVSEGNWPPAISRILNHVEKCPEYMQLRTTGNVHKSYRYSDDKNLIRNYIDGQAKTVRFECPFCEDTYSSIKALTNHLTQKHSDPVDVLDADEQKTLRTRIEERVSDRPTPKTKEETSAEGEEEKGYGGGQDGQAGTTTTGNEAKQGGKNGCLTAGPGDESNTPDPPLSNGDECSSTVSEQEIREGYCDIPKRLREALRQAQQVVMTSRDNTETTLQYDWRQGRLIGLGPWFLGNAIEPGDKILLKLLARSPGRISIRTKWEKNLMSLLNCPQEDTKWKLLPIRDCLLLVFARHKKPLHYRTLYAEVSCHRHLKASSVISCLSKYRGILFAQTGQGKWKLLKDGIDETLKGPRSPVIRTEEQIMSELEKDWLKTIEADIIQNDLVYKMVKRFRQDMSYNQMCQKLAKYYSTDWHELSRAQFFNPRDTRLKRLSNGNWALQEWFLTPTPPPDPVPPPEVEPGIESPSGTATAAAGDGNPNFIQLVWRYLKSMILSVFVKKHTNSSGK
jgi:hypothetical protein